MTIMLVQKSFESSKYNLVLFNDFVQALNIISTFVSFRNITESVEDFPASRDR